MNGESHRLCFIPCWCLSQKGMVINEKILANLEDKIQIHITFDGEEIIYTFAVEEGYEYSLDPETVMEMALIFGENGDNIIEWSENSFPFFSDIRLSLKEMTDEEIQSTMIGDWHVIAYNDISGDKLEYTFNEDGTGKRQDRSNRNTFNKFYWDANGGLGLSSNADDFSAYNIICRVSDDVLIAYRETTYYLTEIHPAMVFIKR